MQAGHDDVLLDGAKAKHHAALALVDLVQAEKPVNGDQCHQAGAQQAGAQLAAAAVTAAAAAAAAKNADLLRLQLPEGFVKVRRPLVTLIAPRIPAAATRFIPRHAVLR